MKCLEVVEQVQELIDTICKNYKEVKITNLEDEKKLKALEIIKENELLSVFQDSNGKCYVIFTGKYGFENKTAVEIPQEEFDLLKEILLCRQ